MKSLLIGIMGMPLLYGCEKSPCQTFTLNGYQYTVNPPMQSIAINHSPSELEIILTHCDSSISTIKELPSLPIHYLVDHGYTTPSGVKIEF